nr:Uncharacterised protein [Klebsiella pneumoniae]
MTCAMMLSEPCFLITTPVFDYPVNFRLLQGRQPCQHILEIGIRIVPIITGRLDQTHDRSSALEYANPRRAFEKATG